MNNLFSRSMIVRAFQAKEWQLEIESMSEDEKMHIDKYLSKSVKKLMTEASKTKDGDMLIAINQVLIELENNCTTDYLKFQIRNVRMQYKACLKDHLNSTIFNRIFAIN